MRKTYSDRVDPISCRARVCGSSTNHLHNQCRNGDIFGRLHVKSNLQWRKVTMKSNSHAPRQCMDTILVEELPSPREQIIRGYRVRTVYHAIDHEEASARRRIVAEIIARSLMS